MSSKTNNMGTYLLSATGGPNSDGIYTIVAADGVYSIALQTLTAGAGTYQGAARIGNFGPSVSIAFVVGETTLLSNPDPIDGLVITVTAGTIKVITNQ